MPDTNPSRRSPQCAADTAAKRYKRVENATAVIWRTLLVAEQTFRRFDAPELLADIAEDVTYINGVRVSRVRPRRGPGAAAVSAADPGVRLEE